MSSTEVILLQDQPKLGKLGDVVKVKLGYARNHLLPTKAAQIYTKEAWESFKSRKEEIIKQQKQARIALEQAHGQLDGYLLQTTVQAQEDGSMYGSITQSTIVDLLQAQNLPVKRHQINLPNDESIKEIGDHEVQITIAHDLVANIKFSVLSNRD